MIQGDISGSVEKISDALGELFEDAEYIAEAICQLQEEDVLTESERERLEVMQRAIEAVNSAQCQMYVY